jgi:hypothetical protein
MRHAQLLFNTTPMMRLHTNQKKRADDNDRKNHCAALKSYRLAFIALLIAAFALGISACAGTTRPPDTAAPRASEPPYPVLLTASEDRSAATLAAWSALTKAQGITDAPAPELDPVTGAVLKLPVLPAGANLYLPKVGTQLPMSEEETRESLRRFIENETRLIAATPPQLSLVNRADTNTQTKTARYEQRPFRYALRGNYGVLQIEFAPDGRLLQLSSTCIPETENLQRAVTGLRPRYSAEETAKRLVGRSFALTNIDITGKPDGGSGSSSGSGSSISNNSNANVSVNSNLSVNSNNSVGVNAGASDQSGFTVGASDEVQVRELVVYPRPRTTEPRALEFHLAWEITVARGADKYTVYLDAVTDEFIAATRAV